jgi:hypothetical protein
MTYDVFWGCCSSESEEAAFQGSPKDSEQTIFGCSTPTGRSNSRSGRNLCGGGMQGRDLRAARRSLAARWRPLGDGDKLCDVNQRRMRERWPSLQRVNGVYVSDGCSSRCGGMLNRDSDTHERQVCAYVCAAARLSRIVLQTPGPEAAPTRLNLTRKHNRSPWQCHLAPRLWNRTHRGRGQQTRRQKSGSASSKRAKLPSCPGLHRLLCPCPAAAAAVSGDAYQIS